LSDKEGRKDKRMVKKKIKIWKSKKKNIQTLNKILKVIVFNSDVFENKRGKERKKKNGEKEHIRI
jgi:hypothetical protein